MRNKITYLNYTFPAKKIARATIGLEQSLPIISLGIDTFECEVKCPDKSILQFDQNTPLRYLHWEKQMGIFFVQAIERVSPDHYTFSAISTLGLLEQRTFRGGIYTGETVSEVVAAICGSIPYIIKTSLQGIKLYGWLGIMSARLALQQVLFAIGANLVTDANGVLRIENLWDGISSVLDKDRVYADGASVKQDAPYTSVTVLEHQYSPGSERQTLFEGTTVEGQTIPFDAPMGDLQAQGFAILERGANYATVSAGSGTLSGIPYNHTTLEVTKPVTNAPVVNDKRIEDATLVSLVNSNAVADRVAAYYAFREIISVSASLQQEHPGQVVQLYHPYDKTLVHATIDTSIVNVSGVLKSALTALVGFIPPQQQEAVIYDYHELITESGTWTVPEGCYKIRAILIGGGSPGTKGENGSPGGNGGNGSAGTGGSSGSGGPGGLGGKILDVELAVTPGQILNITIGAGGLTGGPVAGETTLDDYSSADGSHSAIGYTDLVSGITYGKPGSQGGSAMAQPGGAASSGLDFGTECYALYAPNTAIHYSDHLKVGSRGRLGGGGEWSGEASAHQESTETSGGNIRFLFKITCWGKNGVAGISPSKRNNATIPGCGGDGGTGGGGGGGAAGYTVTCKVGQLIARHSVGTAQTPIYHDLVVSEIVTNSTSGGPGGIGGAPGDGAGGCAILYYGIEKKITQGIFLTATKGLLKDKTGRLIIA